MILVEGTSCTVPKKGEFSHRSNVWKLPHKYNWRIHQDTTGKKYHAGTVFKFHSCKNFTFDSYFIGYQNATELHFMHASKYLCWYS